MTELNLSSFITLLSVQSTILYEMLNRTTKRVNLDASNKALAENMFATKDLGFNKLRSRFTAYFVA